MEQPATRCAIVLSGGAGQRLRSFVYRMRGDALPKQYVDFTGAGSLLERTFDRVERLIAPERVFTIAGHSHLQFWEAHEQLTRRPQGTVILQPENRETAPGVLLPLVYLDARYPDAVVGVFPSDHFIDPDGLFMGYVGLAFRAVESNPDHIVLLGIQPDDAEPEYGYIVPAANEPDGPLPRMRRVATFVEKPSPDAAARLAAGGGLWNTMVMAFRPQTLLDAVAGTQPELWRAFERIRRALGTTREAGVLEEVYRDLRPMNFSRAVLQGLPGRRSPVLWVLPAHGVFWSDWGSEKRLVRALRRTSDSSRAVHAVPSAAPLVANRILGVANPASARGSSWAAP